MKKTKKMTVIHQNFNHVIHEDIEEDEMGIILLMWKQKEDQLEYRKEKN